MASQYPPGPDPDEPFSGGPGGPYDGGSPPEDDEGVDRRWIWPAAAFAAVAGILVAVLVVVLVSDDDGDDEQVVDPTETPTETPTPSPTETPTASPTPTETEEPTPSPTEDEDDDDEDDDDDGGGEPAQVIEIDESGDQVVYLTFDAGSDRGFAEDILDFLDEEEIPASFGITGEWAEDNPDLVERLVDDGHVLVNHTFTHSSFTGFSSGEEPLSEEERREEITSTDDLFEEIAGVDGRPFWRPPFGDFDDETLALLGDLDYQYCLMWPIDSLGWDGLSEEEIIDRVLGQMEPGAIVLLHVGEASQDFAALDDIVDTLREDGFEFASVDRLAE
jgi:peptidoglycan-N-acetylglucosamine deacetylase